MLRCQQAQQAGVNTYGPTHMVHITKLQYPWRGSALYGSFLFDDTSAADVQLRCCLVVGFFLSVHILVNKTVTIHERHAEIVAASGTELVVWYNVPIIASAQNCCQTALRWQGYASLADARTTRLCQRSGRSSKNPKTSASAALLCMCRAHVHCTLVVMTHVGLCRTPSIERCKQC